MDTLKLDRCTSTNKVITPTDHGTVRFLCPNCGAFKIIRSSKARKFGIRYKCANCGFEGP
ncbi:MAG: zinc finger domain-containing protein [Candidatus Hermodarchaeota archaeon]